MLENTKVVKEERNNYYKIYTTRRRLYNYLL